MILLRKAENMAKKGVRVDLSSRRTCSGPTALIFRSHFLFQIIIGLLECEKKYHCSLILMAKIKSGFYTIFSFFNENSAFILVYFSSKPMFPLFLLLPEKKVLDPNRPYISMSQTVLRHFCLSVILEFCLLSVGCNASAAYTSLCRSLKYLLKVLYDILVYPNVTRFLISEALCQGSFKTLHYV